MRARFIGCNQSKSTLEFRGSTRVSKLRGFGRIVGYGTKQIRLKDIKLVKIQRSGDENDRT